MATTKRLTPTGVNMSIPEFTDRPDQRVNSTALGQLADAINTLLSSYVFSLNTGTDIPRNSNFNTLITPGSYRVRSYSDASTMTNIPEKIAGTLYVKNGMLESGANYIQQIYASFTTHIYIRYSDDKGSTWSAWDQLALKSDVATSYYDIQNIGLIRFVGKVAMLYFMNSSGQIPSTGFQLPFTFADDVRCLCQYYDGTSNVIGELRIFKNGTVYVRNNGAYRNATYVLAQVSMYLA